MDNLFGDDESEPYETVVLLATPAVTPPPMAGVVSGFSIGGGRGIVAMEHLSAGCLILAEQPRMVWKDIDLQEANGIDQAVRSILASATALLQSLEQLYPHSVDQIPVEEIEAIRNRFLGEDRIAKITVDFSVDVETVLLIVSKLDHNGLTSGLYEKISMINHSCRPNCIIYPPKPSSLGMAEVWSTRAISAGEECLICYCPSSSAAILPQEQALTKIRLYLLEQHGFECRCLRCTENFEVSNEEESFEDELVDLERELLMSKLYSTHEAVDTYRKMIKWSSRVLRSIEDCKISVELLGRTAKLGVSAAVAAMETLASVPQYQSKLKYFALKFVTLNIELEKFQLLYLGETHPDLARTYHDIAEGLSGLIANDPEYTVANFLHDGITKQLEDLQQFQRVSRDKSLRIQNLFNRRKRFPASFVFGSSGTSSFPPLRTAENLNLILTPAIFWG